MEQNTAARRDITNANDLDLDELDWEIPGMPGWKHEMSDSEYSEWTDEVVKIFEAFNNVWLLDDAREVFKRVIPDFYYD